MVLITIPSAKGQEWTKVFMLNVVDDCVPSDLAVGEREGSRKNGGFSMLSSHVPRAVCIDHAAANAEGLGLTGGGKHHAAANRDRSARRLGLSSCSTEA